MKYAISSLLLIMSVQTYAQDLLDGWYFNPNQPGNGFNVNTQADITGIALFDFEQNGDNQWSIATDQISIDSEYIIFDANLRAPLTGSCFECPFMPNSGNASGDNIRIRFQIQPNNQGNTIADVTLRGRTETYERQLFRFGSPLDFMLSEWNLIEVFEFTSGRVSPFVDIARFDSVGTTSEGQAFVAGQLISDDAQSIVVLQIPGTPLFAMLAQNVVGTDARAWIFFAFKNTLVGFTDFGDDPLSDLINNPSLGRELRGSRSGDTINRNNAIDLGVLNIDSTSQSASPRHNIKLKYLNLADDASAKLRLFDQEKLNNIMINLVRQSSGE